MFLSTFLHAGWNLLARRSKQEAVFFRRMLLLVAAAGLLPAGVGEAMVRSLSPTAWACVLPSGVLCGLYYCFLARAYAAGDFTVVYPVARAIPVLVLALADVGLGHHPTAAGWAGVALVSGGCLLAPLRSFRDFTARRYWNAASMWMLLTAAATVGYSLLDKLGQGAVRPGPATAARYEYVFFVISLGVYLAADRLMGPARQDVTVPPLTGWTGPVLGAALNFGAYWLVLWAYQLAENVSYVVAFRQFSIVIGVALGLAVFRERGAAVRLVGSAMLLVGLVLVALWGR